MVWGIGLTMFWGGGGGVLVYVLLVNWFTYFWSTNDCWTNKRLLLVVVFLSAVNVKPRNA